VSGAALCAACCAMSGAARAAMAAAAVKAGAGANDDGLEEGAGKAGAADCKGWLGALRGAGAGAGATAAGTAKIGALDCAETGPCAAAGAACGNPSGPSAGLIIADGACAG
jgi:hypothetical protein